LYNTPTVHGKLKVKRMWLKEDKNKTSHKYKSLDLDLELIELDLD